MTVKLNFNSLKIQMRRICMYKAKFVEGVMESLATRLDRAVNAGCGVPRPTGAGEFHI